MLPAPLPASVQLLDGIVFVVLPHRLWSRLVWLSSRPPATAQVLLLAPALARKHVRLFAIFFYHRSGHPRTTWYYSIVWLMYIRRKKDTIFDMMYTALISYRMWWNHLDNTATTFSSTISFYWATKAYPIKKCALKGGDSKLYLALAVPNQPNNINILFNQLNWLQYIYYEFKRARLHCAIALFSAIFIIN